MSFLKTVMAATIVCATFITHADEVSQKACAQFLPALGDNNIDLINNGVRRDYPVSEEHGKRFAEILNTVNEHINTDTQARCDKGVYPIMDLSGCYDKCKSEVDKRIKGSFAWNVQDRATNKNLCYNACTGAYVAQNAITKTLRKAEAEGVTCAAAPAVFDSRKSKMIDGVMQNNSASEAQSANKDR